MPTLHEMFDTAWFVTESRRSIDIWNLTSFTMSPEVMDTIPTDKDRPDTLNVEDEMEKFVA